MEANAIKEIVADGLIAETVRLECQACPQMEGEIAALEDEIAQMELANVDDTQAYDRVMNQAAE